MLNIKSKPAWLAANAGKYDASWIIVSPSSSEVRDAIIPLVPHSVTLRVAVQLIGTPVHTVLSTLDTPGDEHEILATDWDTVGATRHTRTKRSCILIKP